MITQNSTEKAFDSNEMWINPAMSLSPVEKIRKNHLFLDYYSDRKSGYLNRIRNICFDKKKGI